MLEYMQRALELAQKGKTSPNPMVGCVIVKDGNIIGEGFHQKAGTDHAEVIALKNCTEDPRGATMYVTLEPCHHTGKTPPCVDAVLNAGITRVVIASIDPNPKTNGKSVKKLQEHGVEVVTNVLDAESQELNKTFFKYITTQKPFVYLKAAITLDGKIATKTFDSKWISSDESRQRVHELRRDVDAVLVGKNTVLQDNPRLNARLDEVTFPTRIIVDADDDLPEHLNVFTQQGKTYVLTAVESKKEGRIQCAHNDGKINFHDALKKLGALGIQSLLVEGGGNVFGQCINEKLVDEFVFFVAPTVIGDKNAIPFFNGQDVGKIEDGLKLEFTKIQKSGPDIMIKGRYANE